MLILKTTLFPSKVVDITHLRSEANGVRENMPSPYFNDVKPL